MFHGYGKFRVELDTVSVLDPSSGRWFRTKYSLHRVDGSPYKTLIFIGNFFYHFVDTATVYRFSDEMFNSSAHDQLSIATSLDASINQFLLNY